METDIIKMISYRIIIDAISSVNERKKNDHMRAPAVKLPVVLRVNVYKT